VFADAFKAALEENPDDQQAALEIATKIASGAAPLAPSAQGGGGQPPPNTGNRIATQEQYDALPPGTDYIDANGVSGTKPA
jgi:hypothetical protein